MIKKIVIAAFAAIIAVAAQVASGAPEPEVKYTFFTAGDGANFYAWTDDGENGLKSGGAGVGNVNSWVDVVVQGPATVTFDWEASSESGWDKLHFYDNGGEKLSAISGTTRESQSYSITDSNAHVLKFAYTKDGSVNNNSDCGWVRNFSVARATSLVPEDYGLCVALYTAGGAAIDSGYSYAADTRIDIAWDLRSSSSLDGLELASGESTLTCKGTYAYSSDGTTSKVFSIGGTAAGTACPLFVFDRAGGLTPHANERIAGEISTFRIIDSTGAVQRNMIPCKRKSDGVAGFYDTVGGKFYPSVTETPFMAVSRTSGYVVTLDAQGGVGGSASVKVLKLGDMMPAVELPTKAGFDFLGYYSADGTQYYDLNGQGMKAWEVDDDVTLTARWDSSDNTNVILPAETVNHVYSVVNETAGTTVEKVMLTVDGRQVYRLPVGAKASITCTPSTGCFVQGENPYVIDSVTAGMTVDAADLPRGATKALIALENAFDTAHTPTTVELVYDEDGALVGHRVTLGQDYGSLTIPEDLGAVTIDLNGWTIRGTAGTVGSLTAGGDGQPAITVSGTAGEAGATAITLVNETTAALRRPASGTAAAIVGGKGGNGAPPGKGSSAIVGADGAVYANVVDSLGLVQKSENGLVGGVVYDPTSDYVPTRIVNGTFDVEPFMEYDQNGEHRTRENAINDGYPTAVYPNGPDGGWNTTETQKYGPSFFEWTDAYGTYGVPQAATHGFFIEMNAHHNAVLSQDLVTYGGDVIRWSLRHGNRSYTGEQEVRVEIGAPNGDATGIGGDVNSNIKAESKATYTASGVTNPTGATYGYDGSLAALKLPSSPCDWYDVFGIYQIPEGQDVTRFAFIAVSPTSGTGNLLDDLTFSTIIGNLKSVANDDGTVTISGYWGDENVAKHLRMELDGEIYDLDMSNIHSQNFTVTIPRSLIGEATSFVAYHEDYPNAKRIVVVQHPNQFKVVADGTTFKAWCTNETHSAEIGCLHQGEENAIELQLEVADVMYTGAPYDGVTLTDESGEWEKARLPAPTLTYAAQGQTSFSETAPSEIGSYTVKAQIGEAFVTFAFEITKPEVGPTDDGMVVSLAAGTGYGYVVSNLTDGVEAEIAPIVVDDTTYYVLPIGAKIGIYAEPEEGYEIAGTNPYVIDEVTDETVIDASLLPKVAPKVMLTEVKTVEPWDSEKGTITVDYSLAGIDTEAKYKVVFDITANGQTASVTNDAAKLTDGAQTQKSIDTAVLFGKEVCAKDAKVKVSLVAGMFDGVQLWENGPFFAECNVGATTPEEFGYHFWWGDTVGYEYNTDKSCWESHVDGTEIVFSNGQGYAADSNYEKDNDTLEAEHWIDVNGNLTADHDAAKQYLGSPWRMMTYAELVKLCDKTVCEAEYVGNYNNTGVSGYLVTGLMAGYTDKSIFLPAAGFGTASGYRDSCRYWISTPNSDSSKMAWNLYFKHSTSSVSALIKSETFERCLGCPVRPVRSAEGVSGEVVAFAEDEFRLGAEVKVVGAIPFKVQVTNAVPVAVRDQMFKFVVTPVSARDLDNTEYIMSPEEMPMPETDTISIPVSTVVDAGGLYGWGATTADNPWPITFTQPGHYTYKVVPASDSAVSFTADGDATVVVSVTENDGELVCMYSKSIAVSQMEEDDFHFTKGMNKGGAYSKEDGSVRIDIGGSDPVSGEAFDSAAIKSKFGIDFTKSFRLEGSIAIPIVPDGSAIGFVPDGTVQTSSEVLKYWCCGVFGDPNDRDLGAVPCNGHGVFIEFDSYANPNNQGGDDRGTFSSAEMPNTGMAGRHIMLVQTDENGKVVPGKENMVYKSEAMNISETAWPQTGTSFKIAYDKDTKDLTFTVEGFGDFVWHEPTAVFGSTTAYLVMGANVRFGPKNSFGVSNTPQSTTLTVDGFRYEVDGSVDCENVLTMGVPGVRVGEHAYVMMAPNGDCVIYGTGDVSLPEGAGHPLADVKAKITRVVVGDGITSIGPRFFQDFWNLGEVTIGQSVASIGDYAFQRCYGLTNVVCEATSVTVGTGAFIRCNSLETMSFASNPTWGEMSFKIQAAIRMNNGVPEVYAIPAITIGGLSQRVMGKKKLADKSWTDVTDLAPEAKKAYHFFKIEMKSTK